MRFGATEDTEVAAATGRISRKLQQGEGRFWGGVVCVYVRARVCASLSVCLAVCLSVSPFSPPPLLSLFLIRPRLLNHLRRMEAAMLRSGTST